MTKTWKVGPEGAAAALALVAPVVAAMAVASAAAAQEWDVRSVSCRDGGWGDRDRVCQERTVTFASVGRLELDGGPNGGVEVVGWDRDDVEIVAKVWGNARDEDRAGEIVREVEIEVEAGRVWANGPDTRSREGWGVSYEIRVPRRTDLDLSTTNGGVKLSDVDGSIDFRTTNGGVELNDLAGDVRGNTTNGGVVVRLTGDRWSGSGLDVTTTNGSVVLEVPAEYAADLQTGTTNGSVDLDFPVTVQGRIGRSFEAQLGGGGPPIRVKTTNGGVKLRRR